VEERRILIVGEAPGRRAGGLTRTRVSNLAGVPWEEWADWLNLLDDHPGLSTTGKGSGWNTRAARARAETLDLSAYDAVILLGRRVAQAVIPAGAGFPFFRWTERNGTRVAVIPHTSGIVRFWNDPANVRMAKGFIRELLPTKEEDVAATATTRKKAAKAKQADDGDLQGALIAAVRETLDKVGQVKKKGYVRLTRADATLGFVHTQTRSGVRIDIPAEPGYSSVQVAKPGDIPRAVAAIAKRAEKAEKAKATA
jgi:hypothetical protein